MCLTCGCARLRLKHKGKPMELPKNRAAERAGLKADHAATPHKRP